MMDGIQPRFRPAAYRLAVLLYLLVAVCSGFGLLGKAQLVRRILPLPPAVVYPVIIVCVLLPLGWKAALRARRLIAPVVCLGIIFASVLIYPKMQELQKSGRGSDQPDCVITAARGMASADWPYDTAKLWTHDPMSCGPGWVLMQTPMIVAAGYRWNLLILWLAALLLLRTALSYDTIAGLLTLIGLSAVMWVTASDGTDFLPFGILLAALFVAIQTRSRLYPLFLLLITLVVQFRFPMLILPILFFPYKRIYQGLVVSLSAFSFQMLFLLWRPQEYIAGGPLHLFYKFTHTHLLGLSRWTATLEVSAVFAVMMALSVLFRRFVKTPWAGFSYLLLLTLVPAALDLVHKKNQFGSLFAGLGIWEGANWMSGCLPLAALFLLATRTAEDTSTSPTRSMEAAHPLPLTA